VPESSSDELIPMGYVRGVFGVKGWLKIHVDTEYSDSMFDYKEWYLGKESQWKLFLFEEGKIHANAVLAKLKGIDDRDQALLLRGMTLAIPRSHLPKPGIDEFYWNDLLGLRVKNLSGVDFGKVTQLMETGAHDILVVQASDGYKRLIPFVAAYIANVSLESGLISVDWHPED
jgi:16S rRNA processing protein RimM